MGIGKEMVKLQSEEVTAGAGAVLVRVLQQQLQGAVTWKC